MEKRFSITVWVGFFIAIVGAIVFVISGLGYQWHWWSLGMGFTLLRWGFYITLAGGLISIAGAVIARPKRPVRGFEYACIGIIVSLAVCGTAWLFQRRAAAAPPIHDVTTDIQNPPLFKAVLPLRVNAPNKSAYFGDDSVRWHGKRVTVSEAQREAYPDIVPIKLSVSTDQAYEYALAAAKKMSWWKIQAADQSAGRIEATSTIPWFGFKDDIVIRIESQDNDSRIDIRSDSRLGYSDIGENARRIRHYMKLLEQKAKGHIISD